MGSPATRTSTSDHLVSQEECTPWPIASQTANPEKKKINQERDAPLLTWIDNECRETSKMDDYLVENPRNSGIWSESSLEMIYDIERETDENITDQCRRGLQDEEWIPDKEENHVRWELQAPPSRSTVSLHTTSCVACRTTQGCLSCRESQ
eukprot:9313327-Pyramimonas_sp.AAC.1